MNTDRDFDRIAMAWLADGPEELSDRVLDAVVDEIHVTRQRRALRLPWRFSTMTTTARVATAAVIGVLAVGGAFLAFNRSQPAVGGPEPSPTPVVSAVVQARTYVDELASAADLPTPVSRPAIVPLLDGRALVVTTGSGDGPFSTFTAFVYDPATGASVTVAPVVKPDRAVPSAVRLRDGRVLVTGAGVAQLFDPTTMEFGPVGPMVAARSGPGIALLRDGRVLIAGGMPPGGTPGVDPALRSAELFDPETLTFSPTGSIGTPTGGGPMVTLPDGRVYMATDPTAEVYDPSTGTFSAASTSSGGGGNPVALLDGRVVLFGSTGLNSGGSIQVWDPISSTFSATSLPEPMSGATLLDDGRILVIGMCSGDQSGWTGLYDPSTGVMAPGPSTQACRPTPTRLADGRVLIVGGVTDQGGGVPTVQIFR